MTRKNSAAITIFLTVSCAFFSTIQAAPSIDICKRMANDSANYSAAGKVNIGSVVAAASRGFSVRAAGSKSARPAAIAASRG